jgi:hypothetical protein
MDDCCADLTISVLRRALNEPFYRENTNSGSLGGGLLRCTYK